MEFIQKSGIVTAMVGLLNALPDTKLYARLKREGRLLGQARATTWTARRISFPMHEDGGVREGYRSILEGIYTRRGPTISAFAPSCANTSAPKFSPSLDWRRLARSCIPAVRLGVIGRERFQYWRL
jgi:hypothetical protein